MDTSLLPTPFTSANLWAICLKDQRSNGLLERWVLADPGADGLSVLQSTYSDAAHHSLLMAFSLDQLERVEEKLRDSEAEDGALHAQAALPQRTWPHWAPVAPGSFLVFQANPEGVRARWVRALSRAQALLTAQEACPKDVTVTVGELEAFSEQLQQMREAVSTQNFGRVMTDLRRHVDHPASRVQIMAYPLAAAGLFSSPEEAMAAHQALFLEDLHEESME